VVTFFNGFVAEAFIPKKCEKLKTCNYLQSGNYLLYKFRKKEGIAKKLKVCKLLIMFAIVEGSSLQKDVGPPSKIKLFQEK